MKLWGQHTIFIILYLEDAAADADEAEDAKGPNEAAEDEAPNDDLNRDRDKVEEDQATDDAENYGHDKVEEDQAPDDAENYGRDEFEEDQTPDDEKIAAENTCSWEHVKQHGR